jgi:hypothetical protein
MLARSSPRRFVAWPRPSSAADAKASTVRLLYGSLLRWNASLVSIPSVAHATAMHREAIVLLRLSYPQLLMCLVELRGFEPRTSAVQRRRSPD